MPRPPVHMIKIDRDARDQALPLGASGARLQRPNKGCNLILAACRPRGFGFPQWRCQTACRAKKSELNALLPDRAQ